jgi:Permuted papain-like amidase enzyme, YaeF/YiiX, C92 family
MANSISRAALRSLPIEDYKTYREQLQTGDLIFFSGNLIASKLISMGTKSAFSHIGMVVRLDEIDRIFLVESVETGVRFAPLSKYVGKHNRKGYFGAMAAARIDGLTEEHKLAMARQAGDLLTQPYGFFNVFLFTCYVWFGFVFKRVRGQYMCSELVEACMRSAKLKPLAHEPGQHISPENIWRDARVALMARLR